MYNSVETYIMSNNGVYTPLRKHPLGGSLRSPILISYDQISSHENDSLISKPQGKSLFLFSKKLLSIVGDPPSGSPLRDPTLSLFRFHIFPL